MRIFTIKLAVKRAIAYKTFASHRQFLKDSLCKRVHGDCLLTSFIMQFFQNPPVSFSDLHPNDLAKWLKKRAIDEEREISEIAAEALEMYKKLKG